MIDYSLKFSDREEMFSTLIEAGAWLRNDAVDEVTDEDGVVIVPAVYAQDRLADGCALDEIGTIYKEVSVDEEGNPVMEAVDGYHVNLRSTVEMALEDFQVFPETPSRVWA